MTPEYNEVPTKVCDLRMSNLEKLFEVRLAAAELAIKLAANSLDKRLDSMNEIRDQLRFQAESFMSKTEGNIILQRLEDDVKKLQLSESVSSGKAEQSSVNIASLVAIVGVLLSIVAIIIGLFHLVK